MTDKLAESIVRDLGISIAREIDLDAIAYTLGIVVRYRPLERCEAMIVGHGTSAIATVNSNSMPERQRFSLGHEIGHWVRHKGQTLYCLDSDIESNASREVEQIADNFSASMLMPEFLFKPALPSSGPISWKSLTALAEEFRTSLLATALRAVELSDTPLIFVMVRQGRRTWFRRSRALGGQCFPKEFPEAESRAVELSLEPARRPAGPRKTRANIWFEFHGAERMELTEDAIRIQECAYVMLTMNNSGFK